MNYTDCDVSDGRQFQFSLTCFSTMNIWILPRCRMETPQHDREQNCTIGFKQNNKNLFSFTQLKFESLREKKCENIFVKVFFFPRFFFFKISSRRPVASSRLNPNVNSQIERDVFLFSPKNRNTQGYM